MNVQGVTFANADCGLVAGSGVTLTLGVVAHYCIDGKAYTQAATAGIAPSTTDLVTGVTLAGVPAGYGTVVVVGTTSGQSSTLRMVQGEITQLDTNASAYHPGVFLTPPEFPDLPNDFCPLGYVIVKVATDYTAGAKYIFGSSNTTATGAQSTAATAHANTFVSLMGGIPTRPQIS